ncbi:hypothetical protein OOK60_04305 [Trichothermofontia sichuanensis B231]|uniref:hypothetical protein n=1 Tax=Trichothermofontia sichuanensis TaxID=3045816 RepID=UPI002245C21F|nr:hypothetical protein [Trichothermofontia sichuanensis]UZQ55305.1 hypothetical protein OOK60_04305 [Trichothermofontia sichuanensis B231]
MLHLRESALWLRFYDPDGNLVLLDSEAAQQQAEQAQKRADRLAAQLRSLGIEPTE